MTMQQIMVRAHQIARQCEGNYAARLALGLRQAWIEARLLRIGSEWKKSGMHRIYFNDLYQWFGLVLDHYKSGNISDATLNGEQVSNSQARKIQGRLCSGRVWYDVSTGKYHGQDLGADDFAAIVNNIKITVKAA
jgi:hypothetical protein